MKTYLEPQDIAKLEEAADNLRDRLLIRLLFFLGCRVSEALALDAYSIDLNHATITIKHLKCHIELSCPKCKARLGRCHIFCPKCGVKVKDVASRIAERQRYRTLPIDTVTLKLIRDFVDRGGPVEKDGKRLLFAIHRQRAFQLVKECAERAGLPKLINPESGKLHYVSPHRLRDAFAVAAVKRDDSGDGLRMLQEHLGHQNFNTTAKYRKVSGEEHKDWYNRLWEKDNGH